MQKNTIEIKTWHFENVFVIAVLLSTIIITKSAPIEWIGSIAVFCAFVHASISERMREQEAIRAITTVSCYKQLVYYWITKEILWAIYFIIHHSWSALVGCAIFALYPIWRKYWRKIHPLQNRTKI